MWFGHDPSYHPLIVLLAALGAYLWPDIQNYLRSVGPRSYQHDLDVYRAIVEAFDKEGLLTFLRNVNFYSSFSSDLGWDVFAVEQNLRHHENEFWDKKLEKLRKDLLNSISEFAYRLSFETYPIGNGRHTAIPEYVARDPSAATFLPQKIKETIDRLNSLAGEISEKYALLYREAGKKFDKAVSNAPLPS
jgi:hypothetical protein